MKRFLSAILAVVLLGMSAACQPTPEEEIVHQKGAVNEEKWLEPVPVLTEEKAMEAPARWEEKLDVRSSLKIEINAAVTVPNASTFPIYSVAPTAFDREKLDYVVESLLPNAKLELKSEKKSKSELEYEMEIEKNAIEKVDSEHPNFTAEEREAYIAEAQAHLQKLMEAYNNLGNTAEPVEVQQVSAYMGTESHITIEAFEKSTGSREATIELHSAEDNSLMSLLLFFSKEISIEDVAVAPEIKNEASVKDGANRILQHIGLGDEYAIDRVYWMGSDACVSCTRKIGGAQETFVHTSLGLLEKKEEAGYAPSVGQDIVKIQFSPGGSAYVVWEYPKKILAAENENARLLPFDQIQKNAREAFGYIASPSEIKGSLLYYRIVIEDIRLGYMTVKRAGGGYSTIPVWDFFGHYYGGYTSVEESGWADLDENNEHRFDAYDGATSMLTLNAMDGSIIDRWAGY